MLCLQSTHREEEGARQREQSLPTTCPACYRPLDRLQLNLSEWMVVCKGRGCMFPFDAEDPELYIVKGNSAPTPAGAGLEDPSSRLDNCSSTRLSSGTTQRQKRRRLGPSDPTNKLLPCYAIGSSANHSRRDLPVVLSPNECVNRGLDFSEQQWAVLQSLPPPVGSLQQVTYTSTDSDCNASTDEQSAIPRNGLLDGTRDVNRDDIAELLDPEGRLDRGVIANLVYLLNERQYLCPDGYSNAETEESGAEQDCPGRHWLISPISASAICGRLKTCNGKPASEWLPRFTSIAGYSKIVVVLAIPWLSGDEKAVPQSSPAISPPYSPPAPASANNIATASLGSVSAEPFEYACVEICIPRDTAERACVQLHCALRYKYSRRDLDADTNEASLLSATRGLADWAAAWAECSGQPGLADEIRQSGAPAAVQILPFGTGAGHPINGVLAFKTANLATCALSRLPPLRFQPADFMNLRREAALHLWQRSLCRTGLGTRLRLAVLPAFTLGQDDIVLGASEREGLEPPFDDGGSMMDVQGFSQERILANMHCTGATEPGLDRGLVGINITPGSSEDHGAGLELELDSLLCGL